MKTDKREWEKRFEERFSDIVVNVIDWGGMKMASHNGISPILTEERSHKEEVKNFIQQEKDKSYKEGVEDSICRSLVSSIRWKEKQLKDIKERLDKMPNPNR